MHANWRNVRINLSSKYYQSRLWDCIVDGLLFLRNCRTTGLLLIVKPTGPIGGITWRDKVTNEVIRKTTGQTLLEKMIRERRLRWLGYVTRMDEVGLRIAKQALQWKVTAGFKRRPGRPRINWRDMLNKDLQRMGLTWEEVEASAQDRQTWRRWCWIVLYCIV